MKLISLHLPEERPKPLAGIRDITLAAPWDVVLGWIIAIRGPAVLLICPDGPNKGAYEIARSACTLRWDATSPEGCDKIANWTSEPLRRGGAVESRFDGPNVTVSDQVTMSDQVKKAVAK